MLVTNSDSGGISKKGANWENYTFSFDVKIINNCIGIIIRSIDLNNYYMFQINTVKVNPHRRVSIPKFVKAINKQGNEEMTISNYDIGWQRMNDFAVIHQKKLDSWFHVDVKVKGQTISIFIDNDLVFHKDNFIEIPIGKVGFRNWGTEQAIVRKIRVKIN